MLQKTYGEDAVLSNRRRLGFKMRMVMNKLLIGLLLVAAVEAI